MSNMTCRNGFLFVAAMCLGLMTTFSFAASPDASAGPAPEPGKPMTIDLGNGVKLELAWIAPGDFLMGSEKGTHYEKPVHKVTITNGFWMGKYEVTQVQYDRLMGTNMLDLSKVGVYGETNGFKLKTAGYERPWGKNPSYFQGAKLPVETVNISDCQEFLDNLNKKAEIKGQSLIARLPTEAEWEYACRAGTKTEFHYGDKLDTSMANFNGKNLMGKPVNGEFRQKTMPVGSFKPNAWGLYDMHGNVFEYCTAGNLNYAGGKLEEGPAAWGTQIRGGAWCFRADSCRSASRLWVGAGAYVGFRVVVSAKPPPGARK